jgi:hypothetical protein
VANFDELKQWITAIVEVRTPEVLRLVWTENSHWLLVCDDGQMRGCKNLLTENFSVKFYLSVLQYVW